MHLADDSSSTQPQNFEENEQVNLAFSDWYCRYMPGTSHSTTIYLHYENSNALITHLPYLPLAPSIKAFRPSLHIYPTPLPIPSPVGGPHLSKLGVEILASPTHRLHA
jgi:hypothetical protein